MKLRQIFDNRISCLIIDINIENFSLTYILITKKFSIIDINYRLITSLACGHCHQPGHNKQNCPLLHNNNNNGLNYIYILPNQ